VLPVDLFLVGVVGALRAFPQGILPTAGAEEPLVIIWLPIATLELLFLGVMEELLMEHLEAGPVGAEQLDLA